MAIDFELSSSQWVNLGTTITSLKNIAGCTFSAWALTESDGTGTTGRSLLSISTGTSNAAARALIQQLEVAAGTDSWRAASRRLDADGASTAGGGSVSTSAWQHVCGTFNWAGGHLICYVDGAQVQDTSIAGWTANSSNTNSNDGGIAAAPDGSINFYDGIIADVRIYNRVLTANEVAHLYATRGRDRLYHGLIHRWHLNDGGNGTTASGSGNVKDVVGSLNGTATASPVYAGAPISTRGRIF